ncbi:MAG: hypothetical protein JWN50_294 [Parcubacteria group bacterium]|nr:hypothetical protein [Parcubacteria group bacterium]
MCEVVLVQLCARKQKAIQMPYIPRQGDKIGVRTMVDTTSLLRVTSVRWSENDPTKVYVFLDDVLFLPEVYDSNGWVDSL